MGHRRVGILPKSTKWREIVSLLPAAAYAPDSAAALVAATLDGVRDRFKRIDTDPGVNASFKFLVLVACAARAADLRKALDREGIGVPSDPTPLALARKLSEWVEAKQGSAEYAGLSKAAAADALAIWFGQHKRDGPDLFEAGPTSDSVWRGVASGAGFCELSRIYFARFTERYLRYFLDREASAAAASVDERDRVESQLRSSIDGVSKHAFETAKITQSFAAGWFNKRAASGVPTDQQIKAFLGVAFGKLREELRREGLR